MIEEQIPQSPSSQHSPDTESIDTRAQELYRQFRKVFYLGAASGALFTTFATSAFFFWLMSRDADENLRLVNTIMNAYHVRDQERDRKERIILDADIPLCGISPLEAYTEGEGTAYGYRGLLYKTPEGKVMIRKATDKKTGDPLSAVEEFGPGIEREIVDALREMDHDRDGLTRQDITLYRETVPIRVDLPSSPQKE